MLLGAAALGAAGMYGSYLFIVARTVILIRHFSFLLDMVAP
jgi:hypothetical protein